MKTTELKVFHKNPNIVSRKIGNETILVPIYRTTDNENYIYSLNESASFVWNLIDGKKNILQIKSLILKTFDITENKAEKELKSLIKDFSKIKAIM